ncbi:glycoside hydrolase family 78 protein [Frankia sp. CNm7]|uniref:alpha-L-rhamnosidase n=1 Tax=Frankia nepalensis TaxID=1836974 RepID=A0A937RH87_9ACTN|nr:glycoside hydrolase family 78 protein [Frankia nepalensis]MBL7498236.1 glycoside hydrolase family 78 protein [Frankia nepalensis]MBL7509532.1 glycoside hydrolase family 78 protein [Frankia nepalensis]MBL7517280.1 glycoside hydrolase family 78 protein [Frankia nepalensis]MBL7632163.1 glycoside hydrolase family 78 protein [Frankia nepalensis]
MSRSWNASFIAAPARPTGQAPAPAPYLRREFTVGPGLRSATLHVTALGLVEAYLNGSRVGDEVLAPGWTSYRHRMVVSSHDVADLLVEGTNALGAILGEGWAVGRLTWEEGRRGVWADRPAGFLRLDLDYGDRVDVVGSGADWRAGTGAILADGIYDGETYDARHHPDGWDEPGFDDSGWAPVEVVEHDLDTLIAPEAPPVRRIEQLAPVEILTTPAGRTVVDFGQNLAGWVRLTVRGEAGTTITLRHAETLIDGEADFRTNRTALATDRYTLRGVADGETWEPRFTFHGFRYVEVDGWPGPLDAGALRAVVVHSDLVRTGWFETSNELVNQLHRNVVWSMRGNFVGVPTDCPQRDERLGWTGDLNAFALTAAFLYDVRGVLGSWLADLAAEQREKGYVPLVVPDALGMPITTPTALWGDVAVSLPWALYQEYGDADILARQYTSMTAFVDSAESMLDERGLWNSGFQFGDWLDPDAPPTNPAGGKTDAYLVATAYLCRTTSELAQAADVLGRTDDVARYSRLHQRVRAAFRDEWVTPTGLVANDTVTAYALAICFDILRPAQEKRAGRRLAELVARADHRISTGFAGTPLVAHALSRTGHLDTAYKLLLQTECPSFLYPVTQGATTIWERWDAIRPDGALHDTGMTSLNHYALGAVADWLHRVVGGLQPAEPGYRRIRIAPQPGGGLTHATVTHDTPHGQAHVAWRLDVDGHMTVDVTIPAGTAADVVLPRHPDELTAHVGAGSHHWEYDLPAATRPAYTLDTPLKVLFHDQDTWAALHSALRRHLPQFGDADSGTEPSLPNLRTLLAYFPEQAPAMERDLLAVLMTPAAGE